MEGPVDVLIRTAGGRPALLARAIASVVAQQCVSARAIVVAVGGAPDPAREAASGERLTVHRLGHSASPGRALGLARQLVEAPFYAFLDDDDELLPNALSIRLKRLVDEGADAVVTTGYWISPETQRIHIPDIGRHQDDLLGGIIERCWLASCGGLFRTSSVGARHFDNLPDLCEWTCVAFRLALAGAKLRLLDVPTYNVHDTAGSLSKSDAFEDATLRLLAAMRAERLPSSVREKLERKYRAALHDAAERYRRARNLRKAWHCHLRSIKPPHTLRYGAYTRKLLWRAGGAAD
ncbi:MAG TPA: glycosyltransferase family 2 protein [Casimicrobiaceae bacterium]|nr:glycosyltransferase family 2 protein [Casimicrobiaceae bacterium]